MKKKVIGIGVIVVVAAIMIAASAVGMDDVFAKTRHDRSNAQSAALSNECPVDIQKSARGGDVISEPFEFPDSSGDNTVDSGNTGGAGGAADTIVGSTNCAVSNLMNQGDGAALVSIP
jgi:hypothetical protein